jgi:hypothetical protein
MRTGDKVSLTCFGRSAAGTIRLASACGDSLEVNLDSGFIAGCSGRIGLLRDKAGIYRCMTNNHPVKVEPMS